MSARLELSDGQLERLADLLAPRIAAVLSLQAIARADLLTAAQVAKRFGVSAEWVRDRRDELGAIRLGEGERPRLRFDAERVAEAVTRRSESARSPHVDLSAGAGDPPRPRREQPDNALDTLPVRQLKPDSATIKAARARANAPGPATRGKASPRQQRNSAAFDELSPRRTIRKERA